MHRAIKKHPLYLFLFRVFIVLILSSAFWIIAISVYYENQLESKLHNRIMNSVNNNMELYL